MVPIPLKEDNLSITVKLAGPKVSIIYIRSFTVYLAAVETAVMPYTSISCIIGATGACLFCSV